MKKLTLIFSLMLFLLPDIRAQEMPAILPMKERARVIDEMLEEKLGTVLPEVMRREGLDMWVIISREYNEDPVIETMLPADWFAARRTTMLVIFDRGPAQGLETLAVARYDVGTKFKRAWEPEKQPDQWQRLGEIIRERNPKKIGVNKSVHFGIVDGITATDLEKLQNAVGRNFASRITSAEKVAIGWMETRTPREMTIYPQIVRIAHTIIGEGFSDAVIQPGVTTTDDVVWWYRDRISELRLKTWFQPSVSIQRADPKVFDHMSTFTNVEDEVIMPGDLLHVDFGITYLRLNTDTQQHAYILRLGEKEVPAYLKKAFDNGNRLQDIFTGNFKEGRTGNEVLKMSREQAIAEGITPSIYTHPIGYHGHATGTTLGMWDAQDGVPFNGDYPLHLNTAYSIELNAATYVEEWGKEVRIMLEEDAFFDETGVWYIDGRQREIMTVPREPAVH